LPVGLLFEFAIENNDLKSYELVKPFFNYPFLNIILNGRNQQWKKELFEIIQKQVDVSITFDKTNLKVISNTNINIPLNDWSKKINSLISDYLKEFYMEIIKYDKEQYQEIVNMMNKIEEIRKIYLLDYSNKLNSNNLFLMGRKMHVEDFYQRNESFKKFSIKYKLNAEEKTLIDNSIIIKSVNIPELKSILNKNGLTNLLMSKLLKIQNLNEYTLIVDENLIELTGPKKNVDHTIDLLKFNLTKIKCKDIPINLGSLNDDKNEIMQIKKNISTILNLIVDQDELTKSLIFKLDANLNNKERMEFKIIYFHDFKEINSTGDSVYDQINTILNDKFALVDVDVSNYSNFLEDSKWKQFEQQNLNSLAFENKLFYFNSVDNESGIKKIILYGIKDFVDLVRIKIYGFFLSDEFKTITISISEDDVTILMNL
jgi:hypothetical protein